MSLNHCWDTPFPVESGAESWESMMRFCQMYYAKSRLARLVYRIINGLKNRSEAKGKPDLNLLFIYSMPFRGIAKMTNGVVSMEMAQGMVLIVNGHFLKGMKQGDWRLLFQCKRE